MTNLRSDACLEAGAHAIWETDYYGDLRDIQYREIAKAVIEALLGQLQMSEKEFRKALRQRLHEQPIAMRAVDLLGFKMGYMQAYRDLGLIRDTEEGDRG